MIECSKCKRLRDIKQLWGGTCITCLMEEEVENKESDKFVHLEKEFIDIMKDFFKGNTK